MRCSGEEKSEHKSKTGYRSEFRYGSSMRSIALPAGVKEQDITATYKDGVLEVRAPAPVGGSNGNHHEDPDRPQLSPAWRRGDMSSPCPGRRTYGAYVQSRAEAEGMSRGRGPRRPRELRRRGFFVDAEQQKSRNPLA